MDREREAWQNMRDNAYETISDSQVYEYDLYPIKETRPNYLSAFVWTTLVAAMVCAIYTGFLLYLFNSSGLEDNLRKATNHAIINLERVIELQNKEISALKTENKKIYDYLQLWTPLDVQKYRRQQENKYKPPTEEDVWNLGPDIPINRYNLCNEEQLLWSCY